MKKSQRDSQGRAIPWVDSRSGKRHLARLMIFKRAMLASSMDMSMDRINAIVQTSVALNEEMANKKISIIKAALEAPIAVMKSFDSILKVSKL